MEGEPKESILRLVGKADLEIQLKQTQKHQCCMGHKHITVDQETRTLTCRDCGFVIDAYDYVEDWAKDGDRRMTALRSIEIKCKISGTELLDLNRKIKNARSVLKRMGRPQPDDERSDFDRQRNNAYWGPPVKIVQNKDSD